MKTPRHLYLLLFFLALLSCKEQEPNPLDKFTGKYKHIPTSTSFAFTREGEEIRVEINGANFGLASTYGDALTVIKGADGLAVTHKDGTLTARYVVGVKLVIEDGTLTRTP